MIIKICDRCGKKIESDAIFTQQMMFPRYQIRLGDSEAWKDEITDITINEEEMIPKEDVIVLVTHDGYVKRTSKRSFNEQEKPALKEGD